MALTKEKKQEIVSDITSLLTDSKLTVIAKYPGTTVKAMQTLRKQAKENGTQLRVLKNRLVIHAIKNSESLKDVDTSSLSGQLIYAFNSEDEVAPAQALANFAKTNPTIEFVGAITAEALFINAEDVKELAALPSKNELRSMVVGTLSAPLGGFINVTIGNVRGVLNILNSRAEAIK